MKKFKQLSILLLVFAIILTGTFSACGKKDEPKDELSEQLSLGEKYLGELDYEQALACFLKAIEIDDKNVEAYIGAADAYIGLERPEDAAAILQTGYELTGDERLSEKIEEILGSEISEFFDGPTWEDSKERQIIVNFEQEYSDTRSDGYALYLGNEHLTDEELKELYGPAAQAIEKYIEWIKNNREDLIVNLDDTNNASRGYGPGSGYVFSYDESPSLGLAYLELVLLYSSMNMWDEIIEVRNEAAEIFNDSTWNSGYETENETKDVAGRTLTSSDSVYEYADNGRRKSVIHGDGSRNDYSYDGSGRLVEMITINAAGTRFEDTYSYTGPGSAVETTMCYYTDGRTHTSDPKEISWNKFGYSKY